jgi:epsin
MATLRRQVKNMVKNYSEAEVKVREATSNDPWGPSSTLMSEISDLTFNIVALGEVMRMIWKRLNDHGKNWRHVYKSLVLLDYLVKNGNEKVAQQCKEHIVAIQTLKDFQYMEEQKDQGAVVREKAKQLVNLLRDDERLKAERSKALRARERYAQNAMGISSDNKMIFASAPNTGVIQNGSTRSYLGASRQAGGNYADPYGTAPNANISPDLEAVRPSDANEEDLQLKLALMLSQQEHEEEVQRKRADDAKLQLALEQSKVEGQPNKLLDLSDNDPWSGSANANTSSNSKFSNQNDDDLFPPLSSLTKPGASHDPWSSPSVSSSSTIKSNGIDLLNDPWKSTATNVTAKNTSNSENKTNGQHNPWSNGSSDPWTTSSVSPNVSKPNNDFDPFSSTNSQPTGNSQNADPFADFFGSSTSNQASAAKSTNPWESNDKNSQNLLDKKPDSTSDKTSNSIARKTPESFLGENLSLVNLDNLIPSTNTNRPKSTNPFGTSLGSTNSSMSSSTSMGQLNNPSNNPFLAAQQQQKQPTINQLMQSTNQNHSNLAGTVGLGQLAQPLIVPPVTNTQIPLVPFNTTISTTTAPIMMQPVLNGFGQPAPTQQPFYPSLNPLTQTTVQINGLGANTSANPTATNNTNPFLMM